MAELSYCRRRLLELIGEGELTSGQLAEMTDRLVTNVVRDLKLMRRVGLVVRRRDGRHVFYAQRATGGR